MSLLRKKFFQTQKERKIKDIINKFNQYVEYYNHFVGCTPIERNSSEIQQVALLAENELNSLIQFISRFISK